MFGIIFSTLKELAVEIKKKKAFLIALKEEMEYCCKLFEKKWEWADRDLQENEIEKGFHVSKDKVRAIDLVVPFFPKAIWENNAFVIALYVDREKYIKIARFYRALQDFSEQYDNIKVMCERKQYTDDMAFKIWSSLEENVKTVLTIKEYGLDKLLS